MDMQIIIRPEEKQQATTIRKIYERAFASPTQAAAVAALRGSDSYQPSLALVAQWDRQITGHGIFVKAQIAGASGITNAFALAGIAIDPDFQNMGMGTQLLRHGLAKCEELGPPCVLAWGNKWYLTRLGFEPAEAYGILPPQNVSPNGDFLVYCPDPHLLTAAKGQAVYPPQLQAL